MGNKKTIEDPAEYQDHMTVGMLLDFIEKNNIPRDAKVLYQRIEDVYFEEYNWRTYNKPGYWHDSMVRTNEKIDSGEFYDKDQYPDLEDPEVLRTSDEDLERMKDKYIVAWSPVYHADEKHLFIDGHY